MNENWKIRQGAKRLHCTWDLMNKIEVQSSTEFFKPYCTCLQKRGFVGHQTGVKKTNKIKKEKRNLMYLYNREMTTKLVFNILILDRRSNTEFSQPYCVCLQKRVFFLLCSKRQYLLKSGCFGKYLFIIKSLPCWFFRPLALFEYLTERYTQCFSFWSRSCPNRMWRKHFSVYTTYLKTWQIHLDNANGEWNGVQYGLTIVHYDLISHAMVL